MHAPAKPADQAGCPGTGQDQAKGLSIDWFASAADLPEALWARTFPAPLEGRWWYLALERSGLEDQFSFAYAGVRRDGALVGIAPTFLMDLSLDIVVPDALAPLVRALGRAIPALRYQRTLFVGSPCSEEGTIGLLPDVALADVIPVLQAALDARAKAARVDMIVWKDMPEGASRPLRAFRAEGGLFEVPSFPGTFIADPGASFDAYLAHLTGPHRHNLRKKLKASSAKLALDTEVIAAPDAAVLDEIWRLFSFTYDKATTRFERLNPAFFREMAEAPGTHFLILRERESGKAVAFMLCFLLGTRAINKFIGIDYGLGPQSFLYFRLWEAFVRWALGERATELQSGQTGYRAKLDVGHALVPLTNFSKHRNPVWHWIYAQVAKTIDWSSLDDDLKTYLASRERKEKRVEKAPRE